MHTGFNQQRTADREQRTKDRGQRKRQKTDDTVLTVATAHALMEDVDYAAAYREFGRRYPAAGYGGTFVSWLMSDDAPPYHSWGNGSAMRVSPIGFAFDSVDTVLQEAKRSAEMTHNHPEGIKGAQATALSILLARTTKDKAIVRKEVTERFGYDLRLTVDEIRPAYHFDISCQGTVPQAIVAFLDSDSYEDTIRNAVSLGGDSDTLACIAGGIAQAYYGGVPAEILEKVKAVLPVDLWGIADRFHRLYGFSREGIKRYKGRPI